MNEKSNPGVFKHIVDKNTRVFFPDDERRRMVERKSSDDKGRSLTTLTSKSGTQEVMREGTHGTTTHKDLQGKIERQTQDQYDDKGRLQSWRTSVLKKEGVREESWKRDIESKSQTKTIEYDDGTKYQKTSFERAATQSEQEVWRNKKGEVLREVQQFRRGEKAGIFDISIDRRRGHDGVYRRGIRSSTGAVRYEDDNGRALNNEEINRFYNREAQRHMQGAAA